MMPFVRSAFNYDMDEASVESGLVCEDESLTLQSEAEAADINTLVRRFGVTGQMPVSGVMPTYQDFEGVFDYRSAVEIVMEAERVFSSVPAEIRYRFENDPAKFVDFCENPANIEELRRLGLADAIRVKEQSNGDGKVEGGSADAAGNP